MASSLGSFEPRSWKSGTVFGEQNDISVYRADSAAVLLQRVHDVRLVRPAQISQHRTVDFNSRQLGHRAVRVLLRGAGQQDRPSGLFGGAAEDDAGSDHPGRVRGLLGDLSGRVLEMESWRRLRPDRGGGVFRVSQVLKHAARNFIQNYDD